MRFRTEYLPVREGFDFLTDNEPLSAVANKAFNGADEEEERSGEAVGGEAGEETECFSEVFGDGDIVELKLREIHEGVKSGGVVREGVVVTRDGLDPDGGN